MLCEYCGETTFMVGGLCESCYNTVLTAHCEEVSPLKDIEVDYESDCTYYNQGTIRTLH